MGDSMIEMMPDASARARLTGDSANPFAPPFAPLTMPRQVLAPEFGGVRRAFGPLLARLSQIKFSFRRIG